MLHVSSDTNLILPRNIFITIIIRMKNTSDDENDNHHNNSYNNNDGTDDEANYNDDVDDNLKADRSYSYIRKNTFFLKMGPLSGNDFMEKVSVSELRLIASPSMGCPIIGSG